MRLRDEVGRLAVTTGALGLLAALWFLRGASGARIGGVLIAVGCVSYLAARVRPSILLTVGLVLSVFAGKWGYVGLGGLPIKPDRLLLIAGLGVVIANRARSPEPSPIRLGLVHAVLFAAASYAGISALISHTLTTTEGLFGLLDKFGVIPYLMFVIAPEVFSTDRDRDILLVGLTVLGAYLGLTALFETTHLTRLIVPTYINDPTLGIHFGRARGPFLEAVANGLALFGAGCAAALGFTRWRGAARPIAAAVVLLCAVGVLFTLTRAVWIGSAAGALLVLICFSEVRRWLVPVVTVSAIVLGLALTFVPAFSQSADQRATDKLPVWDRQNTNAAGLRMLEARPLLGWGWDTFVPQSLPFFRQAADYPLTGIGKGIHNVALSNAVELGLIGASLWLAALVVAIGGAIVTRGPPELRPWRMFLAAFAVEWLVVAMLGPLAYTMPNLLLWLIAGVVVAGSPVRKAAKRAESARPAGYAMAGPRLGPLPADSAEGGAY